MTDNDCDAVVVGSGPGGATTADVLTAAGWTVVMLEKGRNHLVDLDPPFAPKGEYSNDEIKFSRRHFLGPDPLAEPRTFRRSEADGDRLFTGDVNNLPSTVGGGGTHADGKLPRFREEDFHLRSERGPVEGAEVDDWSLEYDDLEPYYAEGERLVGVSGDAEANPFAAWRSSPYPMPPGPDMFGAVLTAEAATDLGLHPYRAPTGANSVPYDDRPACNNCGFCAFGCPIHAKGDPIASLRRALATGNLDLRPEAYVTGVLLDGTGRRATGVRYLDADGAAQEVRAGHVVLAAGAFETPRLLLQCGVGNSSGMVGRHLCYHFQTFTVGGFPFSLHGHRGRAVTHLMDDFLVPGPDALAAAREAGLPWIRGGTVEHGASGLPIQESLNYPTGDQHTRSMTDSALRDRLWVFTMQGEDLPQAGNRIDLDPQVKDAWGHPAGRATYSPHRHELVASAHWGPVLEQVMVRAGADWSFSSTSPPIDLDPSIEHPLGMAPASKHVMGTCRMGDDPATSVVGPEQRFHDVENLLCCDSSVFVTSAGYNPTMTIVALAHRAASLLVGEPLAPTHLLALGAATLGESGGRPMASRIRAAWPGATVAGPAFTVACAPADNLAVHQAVARAEAGAVLVVDAGAEPERGYWGEVLTTGAEARGIAGLVIEGGVRDVAALEAHGFGVFSERIALPGAIKVTAGTLGGEVTVGDVAVRAGDWVVGDADGVVVIAADAVDAALVAGRQRADREQELFDRLRAGDTTIDLLGLDPG